MQYLIQALGNLDNRPITCPEVYNPESGLQFEEFLTSFEQYCRQFFRGYQGSLGAELGEYLEGNIVTAYKALIIPGENYEELKQKLVE